MKTISGLFLLSGACFMALVYGWTYALTAERFPVEGVIGAFLPVMCVLIGVLSALLLVNAEGE